MSRPKDNPFVIPVFSSESQEARWLDAHKRQVEREIERRIQEGRTLTLKQALAASRKKTAVKPFIILVARREWTTMRKLASAKGLTCQAYLAALVLKALRSEARRSG